VKYGRLKKRLCAECSNVCEWLIEVVGFYENVPIDHLRQDRSDKPINRTVPHGAI
jgi:hypothetical protein